MALRELLLQLVLLLLGAIILAASEPNSTCNRTCGSLHDIPYPFGTSEGCYLDPSFLITCNDSTPFLRLSELKVLDVSLEGEIRVSSLIARDCPNEPGSNTSISYDNYQFFPLKYFFFSYTKNKFFGVGCDTVGVAITYTNTSADVDSSSFGCSSVCKRIGKVLNGTCEGIGCCQTSLPKETSRFYIITLAGRVLNNSALAKFSPCSYGFVAEEKAYNFSSLDLVNLRNRHSTVPVVLDWAVGNETCQDAKKNSTTYACKAANSTCYDSTNGPGYLCKCPLGYEGNPYLLDGCKDDINECKQNPNPCNVNTTCENIPGSFKCSTCPKGYEGDGKITGTGCGPIVSQSSSIAIQLETIFFRINGPSIFWGSHIIMKYPSWMRNPVGHDINGEDRPDPVDIATLESCRNRERGVARHNEFRRNLLMIPISKWEDLTDDEEVDGLREVYGDDVEKLDLLDSM